MSRIVFIAIVFVLFIPEINAQLYGKITDKKGKPLPFAAIYIDGTTKGTYSNEEGEYILNLDKGINKVVCKYISYKSKEFEIENKGKRIKKDIVLSADELLLKEVVIRADAEDPAYAIIRNAIKARSQFKDKPDNFKAKIYQKFKLELLDAPDKIFGIEIAKSKEDKKELEELLDTNSNVVLVTETVSEFYKAKGDKWKETIISSKISGDKAGYSDMSSLFTNISFYNNFIAIGKKLVSPISSNAMLFYKYKLLGTFIDDKGHTVNKIRVIPKRKYDPVFRGTIFIVEDIWNIYGLDLEVDSKNTNIRLLDTIRIKQNFRQLTDDTKEWGLLSQYATFNIGFIGFSAKGFHSRNFVDYDLNQEFPKGFFGNVKVKVEEGSNKRDSIYWNKIRPIPLSVKEKTGYHKMDSIEAITSSKVYLDSVDRVENKFKLKNLLTSYTHHNFYNKSSWFVRSPLLHFNYNPVQGFNSKIKLGYYKFLNEKNDFKLILSTEYGFADKQILPTIKFVQMVNYKYKFKYTAKAGRMYAQPSDREAVNRFLNMDVALFDSKNYLKLYDKRFVSFDIQRNFIPGIKMKFFAEYSNRNKLVNHTDYSFFKKERTFEPNIYEKSGNIDYPDRFLLKLKISYKPGVKYMEMPNDMQALYSPNPRFFVEYDKALSPGKEFVSYDLIKAGMHGTFSTGLLGYTYYFLEGGKYLSKSKVDVLDDHYFSGNQMIFMFPKDYDASFHLLPYYYRAGFRPYFVFNLMQKFKGLFIEKVPLLNRLKMEEVFTFKLLQIENEKPYYELAAGLDKIFGYFSLRYSWAFSGKKPFDNGIRLSFSFPVSFEFD